MKERGWELVTDTGVVVLSVGATTKEEALGYILDDIEEMVYGGMWKVRVEK